MKIPTKIDPPIYKYLYLFFVANIKFYSHIVKCIYGIKYQTSQFIEKYKYQ